MVSSWKKIGSAGTHNLQISGSQLLNIFNRKLKTSLVWLTDLHMTLTPNSRNLISALSDAAGHLARPPPSSIPSVSLLKTWQISLHGNLVKRGQPEGVRSYRKTAVGIMAAISDPTVTRVPAVKKLKRWWEMRSDGKGSQPDSERHRGTPGQVLFEGFPLKNTINTF